MFLAIQKNAPISFLRTRCSTRNSPVYSVTEIIRNINVRFKRATSTLKLCASKFLICLYSAQKDGKKGELMKTYIIHMLITIALFFQILILQSAFLTHFLATSHVKCLFIFPSPHNGWLWSARSMTYQSGVFSLIDSDVRACLFQLNIRWNYRRDDITLGGGAIQYILL